MTTEQAWLAATGALAIGVALVAVVLAVRASRRAARAEAIITTLAERLQVLESPAAPATSPAAITRPTDPAPGAFVITRMDESERLDVPVARDIDGRLFADIVARETVVKAASWTHGLRRALSADTRHRIRLEVRREIRRAGRDRRAETKQALREYRARERAAASGKGMGHEVAHGMGHDGGAREDVA